MTDEQMNNLRPGDIVRHKSSYDAYVVTANFGGRVTAVRSVDITNPDEWCLGAVTAGAVTWTYTAEYKPG